MPIFNQVLYNSLFLKQYPILSTIKFA